MDIDDVEDDVDHASRIARRTSTRPLRMGLLYTVNSVLCGCVFCGEIKEIHPWIPYPNLTLGTGTSLFKESK